MINDASFLVIGPFEVDGITAQHPDIIAGFPAPTAVAGLGYKMALDLSAELGQKVSTVGTAVIVHDHSVMAGHVKLPLDDKAKIRQNAGARILDELRARAVVSVVISINSDEDVDPVALLSIAEGLTAGMSFGGGKVFPVYKGQQTKPKFAESRRQLYEVLASHAAGFVLLDRIDLLKVASDGKDPLDAMLDVIEFVPQETEDAKAAFARRYNGWLVPVFVGYQAIEPKQIRRGLRRTDAIGHVFAESIYSVAEFRSLKGMLRKDPEALASAFWKHEHNPLTETYFVSASKLEN